MLHSRGWHATTVIDDLSLSLSFCDVTDRTSAWSVTTGFAQTRNKTERIHAPSLIVTDCGPSWVIGMFIRFVKGPFTYIPTACGTPKQLGLPGRFGYMLKEEVCRYLSKLSSQVRHGLATSRNCYNQQLNHVSLTPEEGGAHLIPAEMYTHDLTVPVPQWYKRVGQETIGSHDSKRYGVVFSRFLAKTGQLIPSKLSSKTGTVSTG